MRGQPAPRAPASLFASAGASPAQHHAPRGPTAWSVEHFSPPATPPPLPIRQLANCRCPWADHGCADYGVVVLAAVAFVPYRANVAIPQVFLGRAHLRHGRRRVPELQGLKRRPEPSPVCYV